MATWLLDGWFRVYVERARRLRAGGWRSELHYHHAMGRLVAPWRRRLMLRAARLVAAESQAVALDEAAERAERHVAGEDRAEVLRFAQERARRVHDRIEAVMTVSAPAPLSGLALVAALALSLLGGACRATAPAPVVETVGTLSPSYRSIATAPVHATTDFGHAQVVAGDDAGAAAPAAEEVEAPEIAPKAGLVVGGAR